MEFVVKFFWRQVASTTSVGTYEVPVLEAAFGRFNLFVWGWAEIVGIVCAVLMLAWLVLVLLRHVPGFRLLVVIFGGYTVMCASMASGLVKSWGGWDYLVAPPFMVEIPVVFWLATMMIWCFIRVFVAGEFTFNNHKDDYWYNQWESGAEAREGRFRRLMTELAARVKPASKEVS